MLNIRRNSRGSIPVTIFVIVVLVLIITTLGAFAIGTYSDRGEVSQGFEKVQEYNLKVGEAGFNGVVFMDAIEQKEKSYWIFGEEILKVDISRIP